jgi:hypothetical protein
MKSKSWMMILLALSGTAGMQLWSGLAHATNAPDANAAPNLTDVVRNTDGSVRAMTQYEAMDYCLSRRQRLPTIRELALYAQSQGARGVRETPEAGYLAAKAFDTSGHPDNFYYSNEGYQRPAGDLAKLVWSSSVSLHDSGLSELEIFPQAMDAKWGYITELTRYLKATVRCVQSSE